MTIRTPEPVDFSRIERVSIKEQVLQQLKQYIISGTARPGDRLPSERELAERLGIGRPSVREALKVLEAIGLVESRIGEGTFIIDQMGVTIGRTIGWGLMTWGGTIVEIMEARQMIESEAARVAAERATEEDIHALSAALAGMDRATIFPEYLIADMQFHRLVGQATHNTIVARIVANQIDLMEEVLRKTRGNEMWVSEQESSTHHGVYTGIAQHKPEDAMEAMRQHLNFSAELWQTAILLGTVIQPPAEQVNNDNGH